MYKKNLLRAPLLALVGLLIVLIVPAAAQAHRVDLVATCDEAANVRWQVTFTNFASSKPSTEGVVKLDGNVVQTVPAGGVDFSAEPGKVEGLAPGAANRAHEVRAEFTWLQGGERKSSTQTATTNACPTPPPPPPATPPAPPAPPAPPSGGSLPDTIVSGVARLNGPSGCVKQAFNARVNGRSIAAVAFYVDGKLVKKITSARSQYKVKVKPGRYGFGRHRVVARVTFVAGSGTAARSLPLTFRRCARGSVAPRFTG